MNPLISVILPIYNVEKYLSKCVDSIIGQTYENLEIILVDDGSPDNCPQICDDYAETDTRVKVVHKKNGGLSDARNAGMSEANGEYVCFIDSDDYISPDFIEVLYSTMQKENSDVAECDIVKFYDYQSDFNFDDDAKVETFGTEKALSLLLAENKFHQHVWNKLYKSCIALQIPFEKGKLNEDEFWTYQVFGFADKVSKVNKTMYYYLQRSSSIMGNSYSLRRLDALEAKVQRQQFIEARFPNLTQQAKIDLFGSCIFAGQSSVKFLKGSEKKEAVKRIKGYKSNCRLTKEDISIIQGNNKFWFGFANRVFMLCCRIRSFTGIGF